MLADPGKRLTITTASAAQWPAPMADPLLLLAARLQPAFDAVAGAPGADPVVRPSDRADAQANGALAASQGARAQPAGGRPGRRRRRRPRRRRHRRDRRARLPQPHVRTERSSPTSSPTSPPTTTSGSSRRSTRSGWSSTTRRPTWRRRCTSGTSARQRSATPWCACSRPSATTSCARTTSVTGVGRSACSSSTSSTSAEPSGPRRLELGDLDAFYKEANAKFDVGGDFPDRARGRVVLLQAARPGDDCAVAGRSSARAPSTGTRCTRKLGVLLTDDDIVGREPLRAS